MCTVTLTPTIDNNFILTSNRDEAINRKTLLPEIYEVDKTRMLFPKDAVAGGTWIGVSDKNTMICLLNGGFEIHERLVSYRQSRGIVVKDFLASDDLYRTIEEYDCNGIEPFTIVAANWKSDIQFYELVWDGKKKHIKQLENHTHIWSSATLYTNDMKEKRQKWFQDYQNEHVLTSESLLDFHKNAGMGDKNIDLQIDRGFLKTKSVTQVVKNETAISMRYEELQDNVVRTVVFDALSV